MKGTTEHTRSNVYVEKVFYCFFFTRVWVEWAQSVHFTRSTIRLSSCEAE